MSRKKAKNYFVDLIPILKKVGIALTIVLLSLLLSINLIIVKKRVMAIELLFGSAPPKVLFYLKTHHQDFFQHLKKCCLDKRKVELLEKYENERRKLAVKLEQAYLRNPKDWRIIDNLIKIYDELGEKKKAEKYQKLKKGLN